MGSRYVKCAVCGREISSAVLIIVSVDGATYPLCSSLCYERLEKEPEKFNDTKRSKWPWLSRQRES